jgi:hypothetical protein
MSTMLAMRSRAALGMGPLVRSTCLKPVAARVGSSCLLAEQRPRDGSRREFHQGVPFQLWSKKMAEGSGGGEEAHASAIRYQVPQNVPQKTLSAEDAVALIRDGDTVAISGFVAQGAPEAILKALGQRYRDTGSPNKLTMMFGGGPGDWGDRGLSHLANEFPDGSHPPMLRRTVGSHYGQIPRVAELATGNRVEAWNLPMGSISRMWRAQSTHTPGKKKMLELNPFF